MEFDPSVFVRKLESENAELRYALSGLLGGLSILNIRLKARGVDLRDVIEEFKAHIFQIVESNKY
jgi:hypothetical protein